MRKIAFFTIFLLGVAVAWYGAHYTLNQEMLPDKASPSGSSCEMACCLPGGLNLTPEQQERLRPLESVYCQCRNELAVAIDQRRLRLGSMLLQDAPDLAEVDKLLQEIAQLQSTMEKETVEHILKIRRVMTPEQSRGFTQLIVRELQRRCQHAIEKGNASCSVPTDPTAARK